MLKPPPERLLVGGEHSHKYGVQQHFSTHTNDIHFAIFVWIEDNSTIWVKNKILDISLCILQDAKVVQ